MSQKQFHFVDHLLRGQELHPAAADVVSHGGSRFQHQCQKAQIIRFHGGDQCGGCQRVLFQQRLPAQAGDQGDAGCNPDLAQSPGSLNQFLRRDIFMNLF